MESSYLTLGMIQGAEDYTHPTDGPLVAGRVYRGGIKTGGLSNTAIVSVPLSLRKKRKKKKPVDDAVFVGGGFNPNGVICGYRWAAVSKKKTSLKFGHCTDENIRKYSLFRQAKLS